MVLLSTGIKDEKKNPMFTKSFSMFTYTNSNLNPINSQAGWQETLEQAQNTIFCKEIYNQVRSQRYCD